MFDSLSERLNDIFKRLRGQGKLTEANIKEALREVRLALLEADVNFKVAKDFINEVQEKAIGEEVLKSLTPGQQVIKIVYEELVEILGQHTSLLEIKNKPEIIMLCGLQGSGKTTLAAKLAHFFRRRKPLIAACDVYRPAAIEQLKVLGKQIQIDVYSIDNSKDPILIAKEALQAAEEEDYGILIIDTAGRLHIDEEMMNELENLKAIIKPAEILFVIDSMIGQDAVNVATEFNNRLEFSGVVLTKLDGDARGGAALSVSRITGKPIKFVSIGEKPKDLEIFHPDRMAQRILGMGDILTLVEKAQETIDKEEAEKLRLKFLKNQFTLNDFLSQIQKMKKMGPLENLLGMIPGFNKNVLDQIDFNPDQIKYVEAIIYSMTKLERENPHIINGSRRKRIAAGSGTNVSDINRLLKEFAQMQKMMRQLTSGKLGKMKKMFL